MAAVEASKPVIALEPEARIKLLDALGRFRGTVFATGVEARQTVVDVLYEAGLSKPAHQKPVLAALAVRDPEGPVIKNRSGEPEPDPGLRDNENVPLPSVRVHFEADHRTAGRDGVPPGSGVLCGDRGVSATSPNAGEAMGITDIRCVRSNERNRVGRSVFWLAVLQHARRLAPCRPAHAH